MIKANEVAYLKTTGEAVFVLAIEDKEVSVRRPVFGQEGNTHRVEQFLLAELETAEDQRIKILKDRQEMFDKYGSKASDLPSTTDAGFGSN